MSTFAGFGNGMEINIVHELFHIRAYDGGKIISERINSNGQSTLDCPKGSLQPHPGTELNGLQQLKSQSSFFE